MAEPKKSSTKKSGPAKCRKCGGLLEGREVIRIGGKKWHRQCAEEHKKFIPREYRK